MDGLDQILKDIFYQLGGFGEGWQTIQRVYPQEHIYRLEVFHITKLNDKLLSIIDVLGSACWITNPTYWAKHHNRVLVEGWISKRGLNLHLRSVVEESGFSLTIETMRPSILDLLFERREEEISPMNVRAAYACVYGMGPRICKGPAATNCVLIDRCRRIHER